jgi:hypothetical protein
MYYLLVRYSFIMGNQNVFYLGCIRQKRKISTKVNKLLQQRRFYLPQVTINCLACPKGVKYRRISNKQAGPSRMTSKK